MKETQDSVTVSFRYADLPLLDIYRALPGRSPRPALWVRVIHWIGFFVMAFSALGLLVEHEPRGLLFMLAAAPFGLAIWVQWRRYQAHALATMAATWSRSGPVTMTFDGNGIASTGEGYASNVAWSLIAEVIEVGPHVVAVISPHQFLAVPHAALPADLTTDMFRARIAHWRTKATA